MDPEDEAALEAEEGPLEEISTRAAGGAGGETDSPEEGLHGSLDATDELRP
jgi:hypothetical protein